MRYLRMFQWSDTMRSFENGIVPMVFVNIFADDSVDQAIRAADELAQRKPGERALMPFWLLSKQIRRCIPDLPGREDLDPLTIYENGVDVKPSQAWLAPLARTLRDRKITLDLIAADVEDGVGIHEIMPEWDGEHGAWYETMDRIYKSPRAYARMPAHIRAMRPQDFNPWTTAGRATIDRFNVYAKSLVTTAIREVFITSRMFHDERGRQPFRISNWESVRPSFPIRDINGWLMPPVAVDTLSSPATYLNSAGHAFRNQTHDPVWCGFIHCINLVRSCMGSRGGSVIPWISAPRYYARVPERAGDPMEGYDDTNVWLWKEMIAHFVRTGVREFLFWNWDPDRETAHRVAAETMRANDRPYSQRAMPEVTFDVDQVTTRGYTTRYSDFLAARARLPSGETSESGEGIQGGSGDKPRPSGKLDTRVK